ncbi:MAG: peptidylprolyl isomerase [Chloroflexi bacterium]|nr:peptidylprolyl isomerase [Chloroflexota bacterium]
MNTKEKPQLVEDDVVVTMRYELTVDGVVIDSSDNDEPIVFIQGQEDVIPGLEKAIYKMKAGEKKSIHVTPEDGYGEIDPEAFQDVPRDEFPSDIPLEPGVELEMKDEDGETLFATIVSVDKDVVKLDFNEPLAGKDLYFEVEIVDLRQATAEELDHGHVHFDDDHHEED